SAVGSIRHSDRRRDYRSLARVEHARLRPTCNLPGRLGHESEDVTVAGEAVTEPRAQQGEGPPVGKEQEVRPEGSGAQYKPLRRDGDDGLGWTRTVHVLDDEPVASLARREGL